MLASQVRTWLAQPKITAVLRVRRGEGEPASQSHQGQRHRPQRKSGCTGALYPCEPPRPESLARLGASMYGHYNGHSTDQLRSQALEYMVQVPAHPIRVLIEVSLGK
jgi:hypothetical protein